MNRPDLDGDIFDLPEGSSGKLLRCESPAPSGRLWRGDSDEIAHIGIRETERLHNYPLAAARLILGRLGNGALSRSSCVSLDHSGFTRFGLRVERVNDDDNSEAQLSAFWNLALILDAKDILAFG